MAYTPVSGVVPQLSTTANELADGYYLKFYIANTPTPLSMATDGTGLTLLSECKLNPDGYPISNPSDNKTVFIPHLTVPYRAVLYTNKTDADNDTTANAVWNVADISIVGVNAVQSIASVADLAGLVGVSGQQVNLRGCQPGVLTGGGVFVWGVGIHNGGTFIDPLRAFPDFTNETEKAAWFSTAGGSVPGWHRVDSDIVEPVHFCAVGDNSIDDTKAVKACSDYCSNNNKILRSTVNGLQYKITSLRVLNGIKEFSITAGELAPTGVSVDGVIELDGPVKFSSAAVEDAKISCRINMSNGDRTAIFADGCINCEFTSNEFYNYTDHASLNHYGILLWEGSTGNFIHHNRIVGVDSPTQRGLLVDLLGQSDAFGGYFSGSGVVTRSTNPCAKNIITDNQLINGSYAVNMLGSEHNIISNNECVNQNHRSIYLANTCFFNNVTSNQLTDFLSSAVVLGYGSSYNHISDNVCINENVYVAGEACININTGGANNLVSDNILNAAMNYGVYVAVGAVGNEIRDNKIRNFYQAGIALENDWTSPNPTNAFYSRPNFAAPPTGTDWAFVDTEKNLIEGNTIYEGYAGRNVAAIYVSQIETTSAIDTKNNIIRNNSVLSPDQIAYNLFIYAEDELSFTDLKLSGNTFDPGNAFASYTVTGTTTWNDKISWSSGNDLLEDILNGEYLDFVDADTTPDVTTNGPTRTFMFNNAALTNVTFFDSGFEGQEVQFRADANTQIIYGATTIRTKGSVSTGALSSNAIMRFKKFGTIWYEQYRNF